MRRPLSIAFALLPLLTAAAAFAAPARRDAAPAPRLSLQLSARAEGELVDAPGAEERAELLTFDDGLAAGLLLARLEEQVHVAGWPVAPGERADVVLTRREVYAPGAEIWEVGAEGLRRLPRSPLVFFWGEAAGDPLTRLMVSVDPATREMRGLAMHGERLHELQPTPAGMRDRRGQHLVAEPDLLLTTASRDAAQSWSCGEGELPEPPRSLVDTDASAGLANAAATGSLAGAGGELQAVTAAAITSLHTAVVAFDTDNQLMAGKFGNDTATATNYIASLVAGMNVVYERDLLVRLVAGTTFLRTAADPWNDGIGNTADGLFELTDYWRANYGTVPRAVTAMLSLRPNMGGIAGVAWVDALCSTTYGYSFTKVQSTGTTPSSGDLMVIAHEIGHNFGSPHTHCYNRVGMALPDTCRSGESFNGGACYSGATSCPAPQNYHGVSFTGSLMSYCHLIGCSGSSQMMVFHPSTVDLLDDKIQARVGSCILPAGAPPPLGPTITAVAANSGPTTGGNTVTIYGANFEWANPDSDVTVRFGNNLATNVNVTSSTTMTVTAPAGSGPVAISVSNPNGQSGSRSGAYFYAPAAPATGFFTLTPCRLIDTRQPVSGRGGPAMAPGASRVFTITGACGVPSTARSVSVNVTVTAPGAGGHFEGFPGNAFPMGTTTVSFRAGQTRASNAILRLATDNTGRVGFFNGAAAPAHLIVDVNGYYQ